MREDMIQLSVLAMDAPTQVRIETDNAVVEEYVELIKRDGYELGPIVVFYEFESDSYFIGDGWHRCVAASRAGLGSVPCTRHEGTIDDAIKYGIRANVSHGKRLTRSDKQQLAIRLYTEDQRTVAADQREHTQEKLADLLGVSVRTIRRWVTPDSEPQTQDEPETEAQDEPDATGQMSGSPENTEAAPAAQPASDSAEPPNTEISIPPKIKAERAHASVIQVLKLIDEIGIEVDEGPYYERAVGEVKNLLNTLSRWTKAL